MAGFNCNRKVKHDDVESGKSVPHWQGTFLSVSLIRPARDGARGSLALSTPRIEPSRGEIVAPKPGIILKPVAEKRRSVGSNR